MDICTCADEAEALLGKRSDNEQEMSTQIKTEFMQLWDGLMTDRDAGVLVLANAFKVRTLEKKEAQLSGA